eukprot:NODE_6706_length_493_cov_44.355856_g5918_i0.p2 GENE.NODE_6706_length_493_cov_44.355856_g5918_i0~~NODE_6706_length_493_cov_44.355856_g5918_i0.p2  ORF type:complete len:144 (-),score=56.04 NODE_6706_length_493_cov_44.355856_g5918_i0:62-472(-)
MGGFRSLDLAVMRDRTPKRETDMVNMLRFVRTNCWKMLFGKEADELLVSNESTYTIVDFDMVVTRYISPPAEYSNLSTSALVAGIVQAILDGSEFPAKVTAFNNPTPEHPNRIGFQIEFEQRVVERHQRIGEGKRK